MGEHGGHGDIGKSKDVIVKSSKVEAIDGSEELLFSSLHRVAARVSLASSALNTQTSLLRTNWSAPASTMGASPGWAGSWKAMPARVR